MPTRLGLVVAYALLFVLGAMAAGLCASEAPRPATTGGRPAQRPPAAERSRAAAHPHVAWSRAQLIRRIDGARIRIGRAKVRVDAATVTCGGDGHGSTTGGRRVWEHFTCFQPTFPARGVAGPDAIFRVHAVSARRFLISDGHFSRY